MNAETQNIEGEIWKPIVGYEGKYEVSNIGQVKSLLRQESMRRNGYANIFVRVRNERVLKPAPDKDGYLKVVLCKNGKTKMYSVHKLVALTFLKNDNKRLQINHKDGVKQNNKVENLEFCDSYHNMKHSYDLSLSRHGEKHHNSILTNSDVRAARLLYDTKQKTISQIAKLYNINYRYMYDILKRYSWKRI